MMHDEPTNELGATVPKPRRCLVRKRPAHNHAAETDETGNTVDALIEALTPTQRARLIAHLGGESTKAIARREGVAPQSVAESLASPPIRRVFLQVAGHDIGTSEGGSVERLVSNLLKELQRVAFGAMRPVIYGNDYALIPDDRLRLEACDRLLRMIKPAAPVATPSTNDGEIVSSEKIVHSRTRSIRRKTP